MNKPPRNAAWLERKIARLNARLVHSPKSARLYQGLGKTMVALAYQRPTGQSGDAESAFRRSLELADDPWTHLFLANMYYWPAVV